MAQSHETDVEFEEPSAAPVEAGVSGLGETQGRIPPALAGPTAASVDPELLVRAGQIARLTHKQLETIRDLAIAAGMEPKVAAVTALYSADPQDTIAQLKKPRFDVIAPGVTAQVLDIDVLTAPLIRAPENLRMGGHRYEGDYTMPQYTSTPNNEALRFSLTRFENTAAAMKFYFSELDKTDAEVREKNAYGDDIRQTGVRVGGLLFPVVMEFSPGMPGVAGWETADCYGRAYFTQDAEGISSADVLEWLRAVPTDGRELANHPLQKRRNAVLGVAGKVQSGSKITMEEEQRLRRAVMPKTRLIVSIQSDLPLDEVRRRVVSLQHLDRPTPFSAVTDWQTRAEAVLAWFDRNELLSLPDGVAASTVKRWLDKPIEAVSSNECFGDDVAMIAIASMLHSPDTKLDRQVSNALRTRGVTGVQRTHARTEVVAHIICRALLGDGKREGARSAMERVLRWAALRDQQLDMRPIEVLLTEAIGELKEEAAARSLGRKPIPGPATRQIAARAAFHLICSPVAAEPLLKRSSHGAAVGQGTEPGQILQKLAATEAGLQQLAQAIFDGRDGVPIRRLQPGENASKRTDRPEPEEKLVSDALRKLALSTEPVIADTTPAQLVHIDSEALDKLLGQVAAVVTRMKTHAEPSTATPVPYVEDRGWPDEFESLQKLSALSEKLGYWHSVYKVVNRRRPTEDGGVDEGGKR